MISVKRNKIRNILEYYNLQARYSFKKINPHEVLVGAADLDGLDDLDLNIYHDKKLINSNVENIYIVSENREITGAAVKLAIETVNTDLNLRVIPIIFIADENEIESMKRTVSSVLESLNDHSLNVSALSCDDFFTLKFQYIFDDLSKQVSESDVRDFIDRTVAYGDEVLHTEDVIKVIDQWLESGKVSEKMDDSESGRSLLIVGERGIGKTYLLKKIFLWQIKKFQEFGMSVPFPVFVNMSALFKKLSLERSFEVYVSKFLADKDLQHDLNPIVIEGLMKYRFILCLFDGLDETVKYNSSAAFEKLVRDIFSTIPFETQLITTSTSDHKYV